MSDDIPPTLDVSRPPAVGRMLPSASELGRITKIANFIAKGNMPKGCKNTEAVIAKILFGYELGIPIMTSAYQLYAYDGGMSLPAKLMVSLVRQRELGDIAIVESTPEIAIVRATRKQLPTDGTPKTRDFTFTIEDARVAGLLSKDVWKRWPEAMLLSKAQAAAGRAVFQELFAGLPYTTEEVDDGFVPDAGDDAIADGELFDVAKDAGFTTKKPDTEAPRDDRNVGTNESPPQADVPTQTPAAAAQTSAVTKIPHLGTRRDYTEEQAAARLKALLTKNQIAPDVYQSIRAHFVAKGAAKPTLENMLDIYEHIARILSIRSSVSSWNVLTMDQLNKALERRKVSTVFQLSPADAATIHERIWKEVTPFSKQAFFESLESNPTSSETASPANG